MKITKNKDNLIITIPRWQDDYDISDTYVGQIPNIIGVIAGDEQGFWGLSSRTYKGADPDITGPIIVTNLEDGEFEKLCKELDVDFFRYPMCEYCHKVIYGSFTLGDKGNQCFDCERNAKKD